MSCRFVYIIALAVGVHTAPAEEPVRIDLPIYNQPNAESGAYIAEPLELENHPGEKQGSDKSLITNVIDHKIEAIGNKLAGPYATRITSIENAIEETEGYGSKILSAKENLGQVAAGIFQPKPIVDTIKEEEKFGNSGDKFYSVGKALVTGSSRFSTFINSLLEPWKIIRPGFVNLNNIIKNKNYDCMDLPHHAALYEYFNIRDIPGNIFRQISRVTTEKLNNVGAKIVGL